MIVSDAHGNQLLEVIRGDEGKLISDSRYCPLAGSLIVLKSSLGFMLLKNRFINEWEIAGGHIEDDETPMDCAIRECFEESGYLIAAENLRFIGILKFDMKAGYHGENDRIEYASLYCADVEQIQEFSPNDEMSDICWYNPGDEIKDASAIDLKLLEYY